MPNLRLMLIEQLHGEIESSLKEFVAGSVDKAIRIGQLLEEQRRKTPHGEWKSWVNNNCPFSEATSKNYRMLYKRQEEVKKLTVSSLGDIYRALRRRPKSKPGANQIVLKVTEEEHKQFNELAHVLAVQVFQASSLAAAILKAMEFAVENRGQL
jgi:hypothetical protein